MTKKMLINSSHPEECRVAVVVDGELDELDVKGGPKESTVGNIYKGVITRVEPSLQAVFVSYCASKNGFLSINDVHPSYFPESFHTSKRRPRIQDVFKKDDHVVAQVVKEERGNKGAALTTNISLAGRYLVLMPGADLYGVSRKIEEESERRELKEILKQLAPPENMGFIIRTAGLGRTKTELSRDLNYLLRLWKTIEKSMASEQAPCLLHKEHDLVVRAIREHFSNDITEILVDDREVYKKASDFFRQVMPKYEKLVKHYQEKRPLFNKYQLEEQIEKVYSRKIRLKSGGYIIIESTEAMVTIDVNSGKATREKEVEDTAYVVNMEAATEIARQLRLRDLGGIIVIDFIDMINKKHIQDVERTLKAAMKRDRARTKVSRMSLLGLLELSRQRLRPSLGEGEFHDCPLCEGTGRLRAPETTSLYAFRKIKAILAKGDIREVRATVPSQVADHLLNFMRAELFELESQHGSRIVILGKSNLPDSQMTVESVKEDEAHPTATTRVIELLEPPPPDITEPAEEQPVLQETVIAANPEETEIKAPKKRRRSRKKAKPIEEKISLLEERDESLELVSETLEVSINSKTELEPNTLSNAEKNSTEAVESDSDVHGQEPKEEILSKDRPRRKATLQDYLPFS
ncbi:MAG: Rne/Rng family ribonuclease [Desulfomonile sp.]